MRLSGHRCGPAMRKNTTGRLYFLRLPAPLLLGAERSAPQKQPSGKKQQRRKTNDGPVGDRKPEKHPLLAGTETSRHEHRRPLHAQPIDQLFDQRRLTETAFLAYFGR